MFEYIQRARVKTLWLVRSFFSQDGKPFIVLPSLEEMQGRIGNSKSCLEGKGLETECGETPRTFERLGAHFGGSFREIPLHANFTSEHYLIDIALYFQLLFNSGKSLLILLPAPTVSRCCRGRPLNMNVMLEHVNRSNSPDVCTEGQHAIEQSSRREAWPVPAARQYL